jgi:pimeloyl-ACP methyl ester carboxylesterase
MAQPVGDLQPLIDELAAHHQVIAIDNRGSGQTSAPRGRDAYVMERMAADAVALMDRLDIPSAHLLGVSMGGRAALALAAAYPGRVQRLVLVSTSARVPPPPVKLRVGMLIARAAALRDPNRQPVQAWRGQYAASRRFDYRPRLHEISQPTLVVHGRTDPIVPLALCEEMQRGIAGSQLLLLDGGHRISLDSAPRQVVTSAVLAFLAATP